MHAHRVQIVVGEDREIRVQLPTDFPLGAADLTVLSDAEHIAPQPSEARARDFRAWLDALLQTLPRGPAHPDRSTVTTVDGSVRLRIATSSPSP